MPGGRDRVVALSGGVGGAKLALGLARVLAPGRLMVVANTGDDFEHLGLAVSPDLDTLFYTLAGLDNPATGWGRRDETWNFMAALAALASHRSRLRRSIPPVWSARTLIATLRPSDWS